MGGSAAVLSKGLQYLVLFAPLQEYFIQTINI